MLQCPLSFGMPRMLGMLWRSRERRVLCMPWLLGLLRLLSLLRALKRLSLLWGLYILRVPWVLWVLRMLKMLLGLLAPAELTGRGVLIACSTRGQAHLACTMHLVQELVGELYSRATSGRVSAISDHRVHHQLVVG
jgi:hypothetical protein